MLISVLIKELEALKEKHGDVECYEWDSGQTDEDGEPGNYMSIQDVPFMEGFTSYKGAGLYFGGHSED